MIDILVCPREGDTDPSCPPAAVLGELLASGRMPNFNRAFHNTPEEGAGIRGAHDMAYALLADLIMAKRADGWYWVEGSCRFGRGERFPHKWLEMDGWALDIADRKLLIMDADAYHRVSEVESMQQTAAPE